MKLAIFDDWRPGLVTSDGKFVVDLSSVVPGWSSDPFGAGWWVRLCRDLHMLGPTLESAANLGARQRVDDVFLRPPALNPTKIIATAANYAAHRNEMQTATSNEGLTPSPLGRFDVFLKAPSSMSGPQDPILLPRAAIAAGREIHHEAELVAVIGHGGVNIDVQSAAAHVLGYTIGIDVTVRGDGDRSRRKSYDTFSPLGPWITTADEVPDPHDLDIQLRVGDQLRHNANTSTMDKSIPEIIAYASQSTNLRPGDLIFTGSPPGVGPITAGDGLDVTISGLGEMHLDVGG